jgi:EmrB/QacA subfamily drug resistance transporter
VLATEVSDGAVRPTTSKETSLVTSLQRWTLAAVLAAIAILMLDIAVVNTALPTLADDLDTDLGGLKWVLDAYTLALASVVLTAGSLADRFGRRRLFVIGVAIFTVSSVAAAASGSIEALNAARAVQGLGAAIMFAVSLALLANAFPTHAERSVAFAAYGATIGGSFAIGPFVGGAVTQALGWEWVFLINVPIGIVVLAIAVTKLRESRDPYPRKLDLPGQITLIGGLFGLVYGLLNVAEHGWADARVLVPLAAATVLLAAFIAVQAFTRVPMMPLELFRDPSFAGAQITAAAISAGLFASFIYIMLYLQQVLGLSPMEAGLAIVPGTVINLLVAGSTVKLAERFPPGVLIGAGLLLVSFGLAWMTVLDTGSSWLDLQPGFALAMVGAGLFNPTVSAVALDVPESRAGLAGGIHDTARQAGISIGVAALGTLIPAGAVGAEYVDGFQNVLLVGAALSAAGALAALVLIRVRMPRVTFAQ